MNIEFQKRCMKPPRGKYWVVVYRTVAIQSGLNLTCFKDLSGPMSHLHCDHHRVYDDRILDACYLDWSTTQSFKIGLFVLLLGKFFFGPAEKI